MEKRLQMINVEIPNFLLVDWFIKSLFPSSSKDVALLGAVTKDKFTMKSQQMDLVNSKYRMLYKIIPNSLWSTTDPMKPMPRPHANFVIGSIGNVITNQVMNQMG
jgi:hypothetical protein